MSTIPLSRQVGFAASTPVINWTPEVFDTTALQTVRFRYYIDSITTGVTTIVYVQFSDDQVNWGTGQTLTTVTAASAAGWISSANTTNLAAVAGFKLYARFGVAGGGVRGRFGFQLFIDNRDNWHHSLTPVRATVQTPKLTTNYFVPLTGPVMTTSIVEHRGTLEVNGLTSDTTVQIAYETSDTPWDESSWSGLTALGSARTTDGTSYATTFTGPAFTKDAVRYGVMIKNTASSGYQGCMVGIKVDVRS